MVRKEVADQIRWWKKHEHKSNCKCQIAAQLSSTTAASTPQVAEQQLQPLQQP